MKKIVTHNGNFHIDDVFAVTVLTFVVGNEPYKIIRTRDADVIASGDYVVDVGGEYKPDQDRFDHHQTDGAGTRTNGIPYSSFGLVWRKYGELLCGSKEAAEYIDRRIVESIDAMDNGVDVWTPAYENAHPYLFRDVVLAFRPTWKEEDRRSVDTAFFEMVDLARIVLDREICVSRDFVEGREKVREIYRNSPDKRIIVLDNQYPWEEVLGDYPEPLYVVAPRRQDGGWSVKAVRDDFHSFDNRKDLPAEWAGKSGEELAAETGVSDAVFCHKGRWMASARSKDGAIALAHLALKNEVES